MERYARPDWLARTGSQKPYEVLTFGPLYFDAAWPGVLAGWHFQLRLVGHYRSSSPCRADLSSSDWPESCRPAENSRKDGLEEIFVDRRGRHCFKFQGSLGAGVWRRGRNRSGRSGRWPVRLGLRTSQRCALKMVRRRDQFRESELTVTGATISPCRSRLSGALVLGHDKPQYRCQFRRLHYSENTCDHR